MSKIVRGKGDSLELLCWTCREWKPARAFKAHNTSKTGYEHVCKECKRLARKCQGKETVNDTEVLKQIIFLKDQGYSLFMVSSMTRISEREVVRRLKAAGIEWE